MTKYTKCYGQSVKLLALMSVFLSTGCDDQLAADGPLSEERNAENSDEQAPEGLGPDEVVAEGLVAEFQQCDNPCPEGHHSTGKCWNPSCSYYCVGCEPNQGNRFDVCDQPCPA